MRALLDWCFAWAGGWSVPETTVEQKTRAWRQWGALAPREDGL